MLPAKQLLNAVATSLREVIAPALNEPYPKSQAYMAALILDFVSRQVEERGDIEGEKTAVLTTLFADLLRGRDLGPIAGGLDESEAGLCELIERLYAERGRIGEQAFAAANQRVRQALRQLLDQELKVAGRAEG